MWKHVFMPSWEGMHVAFFNFLCLFAPSVSTALSPLSPSHAHTLTCAYITTCFLHKHMKKRGGKWWCAVIGKCFGLKSIQGDPPDAVISDVPGQGPSCPLTLFFLNNFTSICSSRANQIYFHFCLIWNPTFIDFVLLLLMAPNWTKKEKDFLWSSHTSQRYYMPSYFKETLNCSVCDGFLSITNWALILFLHLVAQIAPVNSVGTFLF